MQRGETNVKIRVYREERDKRDDMSEGSGEQERK